MGRWIYNFHENICYSFMKKEFFFQKNEIHTEKIKIILKALFVILNLPFMVKCKMTDVITQEDRLYFCLFFPPHLYPTLCFYQYTNSVLVKYMTGRNAALILAPLFLQQQMHFYSWGIQLREKSDHSRGTHSPNVMGMECRYGLCQRSVSLLHTDSLYLLYDTCAAETWPGTDVFWQKQAGDFKLSLPTFFSPHLPNGTELLNRRK